MARIDLVVQQNQRTHPDVFSETQVPLAVEEGLPKKKSRITPFQTCVIDHLW